MKHTLILGTLLSLLFLASCSSTPENTEVKLYNDEGATSQTNISSQDETMNENIQMPDPSDTQKKESYSFTTDTGEIVVVHPIMHATLAFNWGETTFYIDPAEELESYEGIEKPDIVLVTHEHGDHFNLEVLEALVGDGVELIVNDGVYQKLNPRLQEKAKVLANDDIEELLGFQITAIPAYNIREGALQFHPQGRDNGYLVEKDNFRLYLSGDTENTPEMKALTDIDIAFVSMNLPYTMPIDAAIDGVLAFTPKTIFPYHFRGTEGMSDVEKFKTEVESSNSDINVVLATWY